MSHFEATSADGRASFTLEAIRGDKQRAYRARALGADAVTAERRVAVHRDAFGRYWSTLAERWRKGFDETTWDARDPSIDYGSPALRLTASSDGRGHIVTVVELADPSLGVEAGSELFATHDGLQESRESAAWRLRLVLVLETWQLNGLASAAARLPYSSEGWW